MLTWLCHAHIVTHAWCCHRYRAYGMVIMILYLIIASTLLASLLIAIITYKYKPEEVAAQSVFNLALIVDAHQFQVSQAVQ